MPLSSRSVLRWVALSACMVAVACTPADPAKAYIEATSEAECRVLAKADENRRRQALRSQASSGNWLADAIGRGVGAGVTEAQITSALNACIARVSGVSTQVDINGQPAPRRGVNYRAEILGGALGPSQASAGCVQGGGTFQRGTLLCPGN